VSRPSIGSIGVRAQPRATPGIPVSERVRDASRQPSRTSSPWKEIPGAHSYVECPTSDILTVDLNEFDDGRYASCNDWTWKVSYTRKTSKVFACRCECTAKIRATRSDDQLWRIFSNEGGIHSFLNSTTTTMPVLRAEHKLILKQAVASNPSLTERDGVNLILTTFGCSHFPNSFGRHQIDKQIGNHVHYLKRRQRLRRPHLSTLQDMLQFTANKTIDHVLESARFTARSDYSNVDEIRVDLRLPLPWSFFVVPIQPSDFGSLTVTPDDRKKCLASVVVCSPAHLYTLLCFLTDPLLQGLQVVHMDETENIG
jgi:hypothetical protein